MSDSFSALKVCYSQKTPFPDLFNVARRVFGTLVPSCGSEWVFSVCKRTERAHIFLRTSLLLDPLCSCSLKKAMIRTSSLLSKLGVIQDADNKKGFLNNIGDAGILVPETSSPCKWFSWTYTCRIPSASRISDLNNIYRKRLIFISLIEDLKNELFDKIEGKIRDSTSFTGFLARTCAKGCQTQSKRHYPRDRTEFPEKSWLWSRILKI